ncbi:MAG: hypothetical protein AABX16_03925 [Nanoarchaeota archaeon]
MTKNIARRLKDVRLVDETMTGFSIDPYSARTWRESQYSDKLNKMIERRVTVFSLDEVMSSTENARDDYNPRGKRIAYALKR